MAVVIPDKICLYFMLKELDKNESSAFKIADLANYSWKVVEKRNVKQHKIDYVEINPDREVFEAFKEGLKRYCDIGPKFVVLKTDKRTLNMARKAVKEIDGLTMLCCEEVSTKCSLKKARVAAKTK